MNSLVSDSGSVTHIAGTDFGGVPLGVVCCVDTTVKDWHSYVNVDTSIFCVYKGLGPLTDLSDELEAHLLKGHCENFILTLCKKGFDYTLVKRLKNRKEMLNIDSVLNSEY
jgi:hypothetical protein